ncbi:winged helix DNA-binding domain-containing protein [Arthrobacter cavernae]|uniref:AlkZ family DNA glycosylase n=1 Tax=Arthrobacter cavernae TaxID=2817681 RepID=A0A939KI93_9MICC|nr:winged helix DNA-binding domain-containing protein [Arthrobacter cavernae]MBO1266399.1 AlkZ family DNA glycosylase [Arthrobacter cavernae]
MQPDDVVRTRLRRQQLRAPHAATVDDALRSLLAVQSQEFAYARWSLAQRTGRATAAAVEQALADGNVLRTHILRPTWHFVHRDDLGWLMALSAPRLHQGNKGMYRQTGLDEEAAARSGAILAEAVAGGAHKTREELAVILDGAGFPSKGFGFIYILMHAEISRILVSGVPVLSAGGALKQSYALFDERVNGSAGGALDREAALAQLALRYFSSRGPATIKDCAVWSGLTMKDVREGLRLAADLAPGALGTLTADGLDFHLAAEELDAVAGSAAAAGPEIGGLEVNRPGTDRPRVDLIQCYDEYVMGYSQTRHYLGGSAPSFPTGDAPLHVVLLDGRLAGWWRHGFAGGICELDVRMDRPATGAVKQALDAEVARYSRFLGIPAKLV